jgi:hypothetical protein
MVNEKKSEKLCFRADFYTTDETKVSNFIVKKEKTAEITIACVWFDG